MSDRPNRKMRQKMHAQARSKERLGFMLTHTELKALAKRLKSGELQRVGIGGREVWRTEVRGILCDVVYDPHRRCVVSFLPLSTVSGAGGRQ